MRIKRVDQMQFHSDRPNHTANQEIPKIPDGIRETATRAEGLLKPVERENRRTRTRGRQRGGSEVKRVAGEKRRSHCNRTPTNKHRVFRRVSRFTRMRARHSHGCDISNERRHVLGKETRNNALVRRKNRWK